MMTAATTTTPTVSPLEMAPESQRLIAVSLGKIACSRGQKGGINLHRNLLVATVLHKARTAYMLQHFRQRALANNAANAATTTDNTTVTATATISSTTTATDQLTSTAGLTPTPTATTANVEMREVSDSSSSSSIDNVSPSPPASVTTAAAALSTPTIISAPFSPTFPAASHPCALGAPSVECGSDQHGGRQVCVGDDKENTPPPSPSPSPASCSDVSVCDKRGLAVSSSSSPLSPSCEKRFDADRRASGEWDRAPHPHNAPLSSSVRCVTQQQRGGARDVSSGGGGCHGLLKRRRALDWNHESVTAPKVRIVTARCAATSLSEDSNSATTEAVQCDSPISSLVNIFSASFSGFSATNLSSSSSSSDSGNALNGLATCAKEMQVGLDSCRHLVMSV